MIFEWLIQELKQNPTMMLVEMQEIIHIEFNTTYSLAKICRNLQRLNFTRKVLEHHAAQQNEEWRFDYLEIVKSPRLGGLFSAEHFVYCDETHCKEVDARRKYGWSERGAPAFVRSNHVLGHGQSCSAIATLSMEGIVTATTYDLVTSDVFLYELQMNIRPCMSPFPAPRSVLILDNATIHDKLRIVTLCQQSGVLVLFLPPFSYDYNPIELAFHSTKSYLKRVYGNDDPNHPLPERLVEALFNSVNSVSACNMFSSCYVDITQGALDALGI
jgi:hypothetical protein